MKRTIDEVVTLYDLEPVTRKDIYVEGACDQDFVARLLIQNGSKDRAVYAIGLIDIPDLILDKHKLHRGSNRNRVIAMALEVWAAIGKDTCSLKFIVDQDLCRFVPAEVPPDGILMTDYAAMDFYLLRGTSLTKFAHFVCGIDDQNTGAFIQSVYGVVKSVFSLRVALARLNVSARIVGLERLVTFRDSNASIEMADLVQRTLSVANSLGKRDMVAIATRDAFADVTRVDPDGGSLGNGHDVMKVLGEAARQLGGDSAYREEGRIRSALLMAVAFNDVSREPLFERVLSS